MRHHHILLGIVLMFLASCGKNIPAEPLSHSATRTSNAVPLVTTPRQTLTVGEQTIVSDIAALYGRSMDPKFYSKRSDCIQAVNNRTITHCVFPSSAELVTKPQWKQLLPDTLFYVVELRGWQSGERLLPNETQDTGVIRFLGAWQNTRTYYIEDFDQLLEDNGIAINNKNRELVAQSIALMSIPNHLGGDVRFFEWQTVEPGAHRYNYSHILKGWTEIWGCEVFWLFVFDNEQLAVVSRQATSCYNKNYADYIEDMSFVYRDSEGSLINVAPPYEDFEVTLRSGIH